MERPGGHYERAFEHLLRSRGATYITVDEARRSLAPRWDGAGEATGELPGPGGTLKSFDFVVYGEGRNVLVDVKGRRAPRRSRGGAGRLESWVTRADVASMRRWEALFGRGYEGLFVFLHSSDAPPPDGLYEEHFEHRGRWYAMRCVSLRAYAGAMRARSARWGTVDLSREAFERLSEPLRLGGRGGALERGTARGMFRGTERWSGEPLGVGGGGGGCFRQGVMHTRHTHRFGRGGARGLVLGLLAGAASAASATPQTPVSTFVDSPKLWVFYVVIVLICAVTVVVSIMSSKRGHQD
ncbi:MAG: hypothetical protein EA379_00545 [Phycisphaerales bacterium]|nr:MAG: hypothetical protein EA379_00545 [Phycisphaerales bacterium]